MRARSDEHQKQRFLTWVLLLVIICGVLYLCSQNHGSSAMEYGSKSLRKFGSSYWIGDDDTDVSPRKLHRNVNDGVILKSFPVSN